MTKTCAVPGCLTSPEEVEKQHSFPKEPDRLKVWMRFCDKKEVSKADIVCGKHFRDEEYRTSNRMFGHPKRFWKLNGDAVPTLNGPDHAGSSEVEHNPEAEQQKQFVAESEEMDMEVEGDDEERMCRLCLNVPDPSDSDVVGLFDSQTEDQGPISSYLMKLFQLQFEDSAGWPSIVCGSCVNFIGQIKQFKEMIVASHCQLYNRNSIDSEEEEPREVEKISSVENEMEEEPNIEKKPKRRRRADHLAELIVFAKEKGLFKCDVCGLDTPDFKGLFDHMTEKHPEDKPYVLCCETKHWRRLRAEAHVRHHFVTCTECNITYKTHNGLLAHMTSVHGKCIQNSCHICGKAVSKPSVLKQHLLIHEPMDKRPHKCPYCVSRFTTKNCVLRHVARIHQVQQREVCDICGKSYSCMSSLKDHLKSHAPAQPRKRVKRGPADGRKRNMDHIPNCFVCGMKAGNLEEHLRTKHNRTTELTPEESEIIQCPVCNESRKRAEMKQHSKIHSKGPYCSICCIRMKSGFTFILHMDRHSGKEFSCEHCDAVLKTRNALWYHLRDKHPDVKSKEPLYRL